MRTAHNDVDAEVTLRLREIRAQVEAAQDRRPVETITLSDSGPEDPLGVAPTPWRPWYQPPRSPSPPPSQDVSARPAEAPVSAGAPSPSGAVALPLAPPAAAPPAGPAALPPQPPHPVSTWECPVLLRSGPNDRRSWSELARAHLAQQRLAAHPLRGDPRHAPVLFEGRYYLPALPEEPPRRRTPPVRRPPGWHKKGPRRRSRRGGPSN